MTAAPAKATHAPPTQGLEVLKPRDYFVRNECGSDRATRDEVEATPRFPIYAVLDNIRSAHNVGSMFRTADGAHAAALLLCGYTPVPPHRHLGKTALGAVEVVPWRHFDTALEAVAHLRDSGVMILGLERCAGSVPLDSLTPAFPLALVVGNEVDGLSAETMAYCNTVVHLPMHGLKNSLNVSVAFGIALYQLLGLYHKGLVDAIVSDE